MRVDHNSNLEVFIMSEQSTNDVTVGSRINELHPIMVWSVFGSIPCDLFFFLSFHRSISEFPIPPYI